MTLCIRLVDSTPAATDSAYSAGSSALNLADAAQVTLRFAIETSEEEELEALRHARRSLLREEWTRGRDGEEPSLEDAIFTPNEISWRIHSEQRCWCMQKVEELTARASRCQMELRKT
jgi:hypothetical protein